MDDHEENDSNFGPCHECGKDVAAEDMGVCCECEEYCHRDCLDPCAGCGGYICIVFSVQCVCDPAFCGEHFCGVYGSECYYIGNHASGECEECEECGGYVPPDCPHDWHDEGKEAKTDA